MLTERILVNSDQYYWIVSKLAYFWVMCKSKMSVGV